jgi:hypothetical protein
MNRNQTENEQVPDDNIRFISTSTNTTGDRGMDPIATARKQNGPGIFITLRIE